MRFDTGIDQLQRRRLAFVGLLVTIFAALIVQRLYWYQITDHATFAALASENHEQRRPIAAKRGAVLDTNANPLALSVMYDGVFVYRPEITNTERVVNLLADALGLPTEQVAARVREADQRWARVASRVPASAATRIEAPHLGGGELRRIPEREYPEGSIAAQALGFVGADG